MIEKLQPFINTTIARQQEVAEAYFELYDRNAQTIGEYEKNEDGMLQRVQFFLEEGTETTIAAEEASRLAHTIVAALDNRALKLDALISYETHYLAIFEETDERFSLTLPNTGAHISINGDGQLLGASFFHEPYTVQYPEQMISQQQANEQLRTLPLMQLAIDTEHWQYVYIRDHYILGLHVDGTRYSIQDDGGLIIDYKPLTTAPTNEALASIMLNDVGQNIIVKEDTSMEGVRHYFVAQPDEDAAYTLDLSSFDDVDDDVLDFDMESHHLVELQDTGIHLPDEVLLQKAEEVVHALVGEHASHYVREHTEGFDEMLAASPFYAQMEPPAELSYRFLYKVGDVLLHDKPIELSIHRSTGLVIEVVHHEVPYARVAQIPAPAISPQQANEIAQQVAAVQLSFMRTSIEENLYDLAYLIDYPNSPTGGGIERVDAQTGAITYVDAGIEPV